MYNNLQKKISELAKNLQDANILIAEKDVIIADLQRQLKAIAVQTKKSKVSAEVEDV